MFDQDYLYMLVQENNNKLQAINDFDRKYIWYIINTLDLAELPIFKIELIRGELLSLALVAKEEGVSLVDKLEVSKEGYCNTIIENSTKRPILEYFVLLVSCYFQFQYLFLFFGILATGFSSDSGLTYAFIIQFFAYIPLIFFFRRIIVNQGLTAKRKKINLRSFDYLTFGVLFYILLVAFFPVTKEIFIFITPSLVLLLFLIINLFIINFYKKYWKKEAMKYNYQPIKK